MLVTLDRKPGLKEDSSTYVELILQLVPTKACTIYVNMFQIGGNVSHFLCFPTKFKFHTELIKCRKWREDLPVDIRKKKKKRFTKKYKDMAPDEI